eukprot:9319176-Alexandrium_andersonii.AAC.1
MGVVCVWATVGGCAGSPYCSCRLAGGSPPARGGRPGSGALAPGAVATGLLQSSSAAGGAAGDAASAAVGPLGFADSSWQAGGPRSAAIA